VWFDSGVSHFAVLRARDNLREPADLYLEGSDQHRGWFHSSLLTGTAINNRAPYKQVLTHGYVVDKDGRKMSKSLGNIIAPKQLIDTYGADILRLWCASTDYTKEITVSDEIMKRVADGYRRIRNTSRFFIGNLSDFDESAQLLDVKDCTLLDQWAIRQASRLQAEIIEDYESYQFHQIYQKMGSFCSQEMGAFYLDVLKDRLYTAKKDSKARLSAQTAMHHILQALIRWMAPIMTYTADEIWKLLGNEKNILFEQWYNIPQVAENLNWSDAQWDAIREIRNVNTKLLEQLRGAGDIGSSLDADVTIYVDEEKYAKLKDINDELRFVLITSAAQLLPLTNKPVDAVECELEEGSVYIVAQAAKGEKCTRCWHKRESVGIDEKHPELCRRCIINVDGVGEQRAYA
jgi:isoleucyl-tRNA synthetase